MSSQVASLTSFLKKSMKQKEVLTYQQKKFNKGNEKVININFQKYGKFPKKSLKGRLNKLNR